MAGHFFDIVVVGVYKVVIEVLEGFSGIAETPATKLLACTVDVTRQGFAKVVGRRSPGRTVSGTVEHVVIFHLQNEVVSHRFGSDIDGVSRHTFNAFCPYVPIVMIYISIGTDRFIGASHRVGEHVFSIFCNAVADLCLGLGFIHMEDELVAHQRNTFGGNLMRQRVFAKHLVQRNGRVFGTVLQDHRRFRQSAFLPDGEEFRRVVGIRAEVAKVVGIEHLVNGVHSRSETVCRCGGPARKALVGSVGLPEGNRIGI